LATGPIVVAAIVLMVALVPAGVAIAAPAAVGVTMCLALESQARQARRVTDSVRTVDRRTEAGESVRSAESAQGAVMINGVGAPRWRPLSEVRAGLLNIPPPAALA